jgi:hypothetical protein
MVLSKSAKRWLGWGFAALIFAYVWSAGGYWRYCSHMDIRTTDE